MQRGLEEIYPELDFIDEDLELEAGGLCADLVAVDARGRLALVFLGSAEGADPLLGLIDALAFARANVALLTGHVRHRRLQPELGPLALYVAPQISARLLQRVQCLDSERVRLLELRTLSSARGGDRVYIVPVHPEAGRFASLPSREVDLFLRRVPAETRGLAHGLLRRLLRIDDQLELSSGETQLTWKLGGEVLCMLHLRGRLLEGRVPPQPAPVALQSELDVEPFLGAVLSRCLTLLGETRELPPAARRAPGSEGAPASRSGTGRPGESGTPRPVVPPIEDLPAELEGPLGRAPVAPVAPFEPFDPSEAEPGGAARLDANAASRRARPAAGPADFPPVFAAQGAAVPLGSFGTEAPLRRIDAADAGLVLSREELEAFLR